LAASQSGWCEVYDIYLSTAISTPWGTTNILRLTDLPSGAGFNFFTPTISPEAVGTQGDAAVYYFWPIKRQLVKSDGKTTNDKMQISASNVTAEFAGMIAAVIWYDTPIVIRKVPISIAGATADDCAVLWSGAVDSVRVTEKMIALECSSDFASLTTTAPRENMHTHCRFAWGDDQCTAIRFLAAHYKAKTVGSSSTTTVVKSADFTEDASAVGSFGTDLVNALADGSITTSSQRSGLSATSCKFYISTRPYGSVPTDRCNVKNNLSDGDRVQFGGTTAPSGLTFGTWYYVRDRDRNGFSIAATAGGTPIVLTTSGLAVTVTSEFGWEGYQVKSSKSSHWAFATDADWGTEVNGFYQIPDAQAGLENAALKPYIQFDFGSAKQPRVWRVSTLASVAMEELVRLISIFSSTDNSTWRHETYFEIPPVGGVLYDVLIPTAQSARYWRICIRSRWASSLYYKMLSKVYAYENSRHYWARGRITFASNTTTVALRGISRRVIESYSGEAHVAALPVAPASGDTFVIERGCGRTFNHCCERQNWENFGGFLDLPFQAVVR
ncbi:MAG: phage BR0599 family protein, partial [Akkermansiaceae bacterium]|nr:phage BR0599 family protein [Verrucomicrobiales bacterium]